MQVAQFYGFPASAKATGQTIGVLELGGGYRAADITAYFQSLGVSAPKVSAVLVDKGTNSPGDPNGADGEVMLDIEVSAAVAPGANVVVYFAPNTDQGFIDAITTAVHDSTNKPSVLSISWGGPESTWTAQAVTALDQACQSAAALGVTITVASGDDGSTDGVTGGGNNVDFPASSPHVLACGGTKLVASGTTITSETAWNELSANEGATGGGVSTLFPLPTWQASSKVPAPTTSSGGRGVPDVAGDADPATGYTVRVDGETTHHWRNQCGRSTVGRADRTGECGERAGRGVCKPDALRRSKGVPRHYKRQQRRVQRGSRMGRLHRPGQPEWSGGHRCACAKHDEERR